MEETLLTNRIYLIYFSCNVEIYIYRERERETERQRERERVFGWMQYYTTIFFNWM